ncbi:MAG: hypothetical protein IKY33_00495 [Clostridia bacterium]|nr:hypothetical protein [Clostridia bacterium]
MKRILALLLAMMLLLSFAACSAPAENNEGGETNSGETENAEVTVGSTLLADFKAKADGTAQEIAEGLLENEIIQFMGAAMPVEQGLLTGFGETEIKGFKEGVMFAPMIGTIPFVGYIFTLEEGTDVETFKTTLKDNANLRWNICTTAEELVVENEGDKVFFLMCPKSFEQAEGGEAEGGDVGGDMAVGGEDMIPAEDGITLE